jgi:hypothetical protein
MDSEKIQSIYNSCGGVLWKPRNIKQSPLGNFENILVAVSLCSYLSFPPHAGHLLDHYLHAAWMPLYRDQSSTLFDLKI